MKKMIGLFSLIAILTLTFSVGANAETPPEKMELVCDIGHDTVEFVPQGAGEIGFFVNVTVDTLICTGEGGLEVDVSDVTADALLNYDSKNTLTGYSYLSPDTGFTDTGTPKNYKKLS